MSRQRPRPERLWHVHPARMILNPSRRSAVTHPSPDHPRHQAETPGPLFDAGDRVRIGGLKQKTKWVHRTQHAFIDSFIHPPIHLLIPAFIHSSQLYYFSRKYTSTYASINTCALQFIRTYTHKHKHISAILMIYLTLKHSYNATITLTKNTEIPQRSSENNLIC